MRLFHGTPLVPEMCFFSSLKKKDERCYRNGAQTASFEGGFEGQGKRQGSLPRSRSLLT